MTALAPHDVSKEAFRHEAFFYGDEAEFVDGTTSFIRDGLANGEPTLVVVNAEKISVLGAALGPDAGSVLFADMADVGRNPARIIPAWRRFVAEQASPDRRLRGIGEPIWPERSPAELVECHRHESLLNLAFSGGPPFWLLCPYNTSALDQAVLDYANRNHAFLHQGRASRPSADFGGLEGAAAPFDEALPEPDDEVTEHTIRPDGLGSLRRYVRADAAGAGLSDERVAAAVLAVSELAANSLRHGGGGGTLRSWHAGDGVVHEVRDTGHIDQPLAGRELPAADGVTGRGLWLVNQVCDLVQLRSSPAGTVVRVHVRSD